jgi:deoxyhypusine synthase
MSITTHVNGKHGTLNQPHNSDLLKPYDLSGLKTYDLISRPSKVFHEDLGKPVTPSSTIDEWLSSLPQQLAANDLRRVAKHMARAASEGCTVAAGLGGHVIKTGCAPYLIDWIQRGVLQAVALNGSAAIHDFELALAGKTSENVSAQLPTGQFGMARETADAFAVAARLGAENELGLGWALGKHLESLNTPYAESSLVLAAYRAGIPCTIHVALGTDIVHMHPHVSGAALGEASLTDFRRLCSVVASMNHGVWLNLGSAVIMPEVFVKAVSVAHNFGHNLDGLVTVNVDKQAQYRSRVNVVERPSAEGFDLIGHHEILLPLLHVAVASQLAGQEAGGRKQEAEARKQEAGSRRQEAEVRSSAA